MHLPVSRTGRRSEADEYMLHAIRQACPDAHVLYIFDARSNLAANGNKLMVRRRRFTCWPATQSNMQAP